MTDQRPTPSVATAATLWERDCGATHRDGVLVLTGALVAACVDALAHPLFTIAALAYLIVVVAPVAWVAAHQQTRAAITHITGNTVAFVASYQLRWYHYLRPVLPTRDTRRALRTETTYVVLGTVGVPMAVAGQWLTTPGNSLQTGALGMVYPLAAAAGITCLVFAWVWRHSGRVQLLSASGVDVANQMGAEGCEWSWLLGWEDGEDSSD